MASMRSFEHEYVALQSCIAGRWHLGELSVRSDHAPINTVLITGRHVSSMAHQLLRRSAHTRSIARTTCAVTFMQLVGMRRLRYTACRHPGTLRTMLVLHSEVSSAGE
jgi:hypothetical protein